MTKMTPIDLPVDQRKLAEKLTSMLECPICLNFFAPSVALCRENGHAICLNCKRNVNNCPYCKSYWSPIRNIFVEQLLQILLDQCLFCQEFIPAVRKEEHEKKYCNKKVIQCFIFSRGGRCPCFAPRDSLWRHLYDKHVRQKCTILLDEKVTIPIKNIFFNKNFSVMFEVIFRNSRRQSLIILLRLYGDKERKLLCFSVNILNENNEGIERYLFRLGIRRKGVETSSFIGPCIPICLFPEKPDRFPGGHPTGRVVVPKNNNIFLDPAQHLYRFSFKMLKSYN